MGRPHSRHGNLPQNRLKKKFPAVFRSKKIAVLGISHDYTYMDPKLVSLLKRKMSKYIGNL